MEGGVFANHGDADWEWLSSTVRPESPDIPGLVRLLGPEKGRPFKIDRERGPPAPGHVRHASSDVWRLKLANGT